MADLYCAKCHKTRPDKYFYTSNNLEKYPTGKLSECKDCATMHIDNFDPETYVPLMIECDVPYVPRIWNSLLAKWGSDPSKLKGGSIFGRYLAQMKLNQFKKFRYKDTEFVRQLEEKELRESLENQGYDEQAIIQAIEDSRQEPEKPLHLREDAPAQPQVFVVARELGLTDEDRTYLAIKWGGNYREEEWVQLEQLYTDMMESYDIQAAGDKNSLLLMCKASLKANQLMDIGDIEGAQKATKMYDQLMKAGKWTAQQNKGENGEYVDSLSELVDICEKQGFIPRYYTDGPQDKVDKVILDTQHYVHSLVTEEMGLGTLIERAMKLLQEEKEAINLAGNEMDGDAEDALFDYDRDIVDLSNDDFRNFSEFEDELENEDFELEEEDL